MDIVPILLNTFLVFFLIAMNGFFVAAEFCCVKMRPSRLETLIQEGNTRAKYAKKLIDELDEALSVTQLGITLASLGLGWVGEPFVAELISPAIHALGFFIRAGVFADNFNAHNLGRTYSKVNGNRRK